jgi:hypothetical protein
MPPPALLGQSVPKGNLCALDKTPFYADQQGVGLVSWRSPTMPCPKQLVDADSRCKLAACARADARGLDQIHTKVLYLCTLPKRRASIRGSAGLERLEISASCSANGASSC